jgi:peptidoglycan/xylan/chitin deacetylase (PgdA/CDA1 family)
MSALILLYHDLARSLAGIAPGHRPYVLDPKVFHYQMQAIATTQISNPTVTEWCAAPNLNQSIVLTFDDGHMSNHDLALPILLEQGLKGTFFVTAGFIGNGVTMDWRQIRALHAAGMEIGSHTLTHRPPSTLADKELRYELSESRRILEDGLGAPVTSISSPTGFFNPRMCKLAQEVGYRSLCIGRIALVSDNGDLYALNRVAIKRAMTEKQFKKLVRFDRCAIRALRSKQWAKDLARRIAGPEGYMRFRKLVMKRLAHARSASC